MAINPTYTHDTVLSKVKLGNTTYYLKDVDLRDIVNAFGNATAKDWTGTVAENGADLPTAGAVYSAIETAVADLEGAMHFIGLSTTDPSTGTVTIDGEVYAGEDGDVVLYGTKEYVKAGNAWREIGDEGLWVPKTLTIAGIDLQDDITAAELKRQLSLAALAYANTASVTVDDYATGITGASYTPAGTVTATVDATATAATLTKADYTPTGSVSGTVVPTGTIGLAADKDGFQVTGTNAPSAVRVTPNTETVLKSVKTEAVAPSFTEGAFTPGSFTKGSAVVAATEGVVAAIDSTDKEMLVFTAAATDNVMDYDATYVAPSKAADTFSAGSAAVFDTQSVMTGVASATAAAQVFTGGKVGATFTGDTNNISANFSGTKVTEALVTGVSYDKVSVSDFAFAGTAATITPTLNKGNKTITVTPDAVTVTPDAGA